MKLSAIRRALRIGEVRPATASPASQTSGAPDAERLKVGVVLTSPVSKTGWTRQHCLGVASICEALGDRVEVTILEGASSPDAARQAFEKLATDGHRLIFGTSFSHGTTMRDVAARFPEVAFEHGSGAATLPNLGTFAAKYHEAAYVIGAAAGHMSGTGRIGFIGSSLAPDFSVPANALILGARSVNPKATCNAIYMNSWFDRAKETAAVDMLSSQGCDVVCPLTNTTASVEAAEARGIWCIGYASDMTEFAPKTHLTALTLDWSSIYVAAAEAVAAGKWKSAVKWNGLADGVVGISPYSSAIPADVRDRLEAAEEAVRNGELESEFSSWMGEHPLKEAMHQRGGA